MSVDFYIESPLNPLNRLPSKVSASLTQMLLVSLLLLGPGHALAQYKSSFTVLKEHIRVDVKDDGSNRYQMERVIRIDTPTGV
ncbi:MAG: hypothetical protein RL585_1254, partial [Pseudomonadota bacterium]